MGYAEKFLARKNPASIAAERKQQVEFMRGGRDPRVARIMQLPANGVEAPAVEAKHLRPIPFLGSIGSAAQQRPYPGRQFARAERFRHVVVGADLQSEDAVDFFAKGGQHQDRNVRLRAKTAADAEAVFARQHDIKHDKIEFLVAKRGVHPNAVPGYFHDHAVFGERVAQHARDFAVVFDDEDTRTLPCRSGFGAQIAWVPLPCDLGVCHGLHRCLRGRQNRYPTRSIPEG